MKTFMIYIVTREIKHERDSYTPEIWQIAATRELAEKIVNSEKVRTRDAYFYDIEEYEVMTE